MTSPEPTRGERIAERLTAIGISKVEFAERAGLDRGTVTRAADDDPTVRPTTYSKIERALSELEDEIGMAESGRTVTSTIEYRGARITMAGTPDEVARAIREVLAGD